MHDLRRRAQALMLVAMAACGGACGGPSASAPPPNEPLVIPPMGTAGAPPIPLPPPSPPPRHAPTDEECLQIMTRLVEISLDEAGLKDPKQREQMIKQFTTSSLDTKRMCEHLKVDDEAMRCVSSATNIAAIHACTKSADDPQGDDDDR